MQEAPSDSRFPIRIGTRGSRLAMMQAQEVRALLAQAMRVGFEALEIVPIQTKGDRERDRPFGDIGGQGLFCREIEEALLDQKIDIAVHSFKDMPTVQPTGLTIDCVLTREDPRDALVSFKFGRIEDLPAGAVIGTSSVRRRAQLLHCNPNLDIVEFRGNLDTRLKKLADGKVEATVLAAAGIKRLGVLDVPARNIPPSKMLPAAGQGAICVECRENDMEILTQLGKIGNRRSYLEVQAERSFVFGLGGGCQTPIGALAREKNGKLELRGEVLSEGGTARSSGSITGRLEEAKELGRKLAKLLNADGNPAEIRSS